MGDKAEVRTVFTDGEDFGRPHAKRRKAHGLVDNKVVDSSETLTAPRVTRRPT